jgi:hypothetical protein
MTRTRHTRILHFVHWIVNSCPPPRTRSRKCVRRANAGCDRNQLGARLSHRAAGRPLCRRQRCGRMLSQADRGAASVRSRN